MNKSPKIAREAQECLDIMEGRQRYPVANRPNAIRVNTDAISTDNGSKEVH
jgi:hypothetical protein